MYKLIVTPLLNKISIELDHNIVAVVYYITIVAIVDMGCLYYGLWKQAALVEIEYLFSFAAFYTVHCEEFSYLKELTTAIIRHNSTYT